MRVDLNADLGESFGNYTIGNDDKIIPLITSANVACGFHASDPSVMLNTLKHIKQSGNTGLGAHPGYPDLGGFGRRYMALSYDEVHAIMLYQLGALKGMAETLGLTMNHVKPHGALYNATFTDKTLADTIAKSVHTFDPSLKLMGLSQQNLVESGKEIGLDVINEVFLDRAYEDDGTLVSRRKTGALIHDTNVAIERAIRMVKDGTVESINGKEINIQADSICVHGDGEKALEFIKEVRHAFKAENIEITTV